MNGIVPFILLLCLLFSCKNDSIIEETSCISGSYGSNIDFLIQSSHMVAPGAL